MLNKYIIPQIRPLSYIGKCSLDPEKVVDMLLTCGVGNSVNGTLYLAVPNSCRDNQSLTVDPCKSYYSMTKREPLV